MTSLRAPSASRFTRTQHILIAWVFTLACLAALAYLVYAATQASLAIGKDLLHAQVRTAGGVTTWGKLLLAETPSMAALKCNFNTACSGWFGEAFNLRFNLQMQALPMMLTFLGMVFAWRQVPSTLVKKDPGQGKWAGLDDKAIAYLVKVPVPDKKFKLMLDKLDKRSPSSLYLGHFVPWDKASGAFQWNQVKLALLRERARHENVLVLGAPGSGKTRGFFRQNIILDAHYGRTAIVYDLKWPQMDSGFGDMALYWHRLGRPVYVFAPFEPNSMRMPLLEGIETLDEALKLSRAIIAPPEYKEETGAYFKDNERRALAAMILAIAQGPTPNMRELQRLGEMNVEEFTLWFRRQQNPEIRNALKSMFDKRDDQISDMLAGVINKLSIFYNPMVSRATSAGANPSEIIDLKKIAREGGLLILGIPSKEVQAGEGEILMQLIKRRIDRAVLDVADSSPGGELPQTLTNFMDEVPGFGRVPYLMANLSQLRSKGVCFILGVQNSDQGGLVYTRDYWRALSTNNIGTRVEFIQGVSQDDAKNLSEEIGEYTVEEESAGKSGHPLFSTPWSDQTRKTESVKLTKRRLLTPEEIKRAPRDLAVVFAKGQNPMLIATPSVEAPTVDLMDFDGRVVTVDNQLHALWQRTMGGVTDIEAETKALVARLSAGEATEVKREVIQSAPEYWMTWLQELLSTGAMVRAQKSDDKLKIMITRDTLATELNRERDINYFIGEGWLNVATNEEELTITQEGLNVAGKVLSRALRHFLATGPALYWARTNAARVQGYPGHEGKAADALYSAEILAVTEEVARELYRVVPDLPHISKDGRVFVQIPLSDPQALSEAIERAKLQEEEAAATKATRLDRGASGVEGRAGGTKTKGSDAKSNGKRAAGKDPAVTEQATAAPVSPPEKADPRSAVPAPVEERPAHTTSDADQTDNLLGALEEEA
ncbi:type IV secretory system conjugative DNA transfer family protein [Deinococcus soli (ex Cha et al. 2016)]|uniref:type IV secretory system conjugative DNA transfer family protein n=1 Tax=Deinococcus soli (ex Cha et al. 2016) TaxID=1309411 RepID=UPI00166E0A2D|nr:type IV secretory system conjugative DNA transfer family protein [Deinococcus soli (ex Cha et al. 2016)]GGB73775.1 hypothetical protein GCM10008019_32470 [Deinococcus soli (ex Cha et al. 2016)]